MRRIRYPKPDGPIQGILDEQNAQYAKLSQVSIPMNRISSAADWIYDLEEGRVVLQKRQLGTETKNG